MAAIAPVRRGNTQRRPFSQRGVKSLTNLRFANESARPLANLTICGQRSGRECIFTANASVCSAKNARNDVHAVISDESLVLPRLCQYSEAAGTHCVPAAMHCLCATSYR